jgi:hypothetical protein
MTEHLEDGKPQHRKAYAWRSASITEAGSDPTVSIITKSGFETMFSQLQRDNTPYAAHHIKISTNGTAYFRLNSATNDIITVTSTTPYENLNCVVSAIYVATGGAGVITTVQME